MQLKEISQLFLREARDLLARMHQARPELEDALDSTRRASCLRLVYLSHTLRGAAGFSGFKDISATAQDMEYLLKAQMASSEPIPMEVVEGVLQLLAELTRQIAALEQSV